MLTFSMGVSADGFINDRDGGIGWTVPSDELFALHLARTRELDAHLCGRRLYEIMLVWENDPSFPDSDEEVEFAAVWTALPKIVFSHTLTSVAGSNTRLAEGSVADELARLGADANAEIGGAELAHEAIGLGLVDEFQLFRYPVVLGGGTPYFPAGTENIELDLVDVQTFAAGQSTAASNWVIHEHYRRPA